MADVDKRMINFRAAKHVVGPDEGNCDIEPIFVNHAEAAWLGTDVFIDFGVILAEDFVAVANSRNDETLEVPFHAIGRLAMSINTFVRLRSKVNELFAAIEQAEQTGSLLDPSLKKSPRTG